MMIEIDPYLLIILSLLGLALVGYCAYKIGYGMGHFDGQFPDASKEKLNHE
jgi:hypothetical protein